MAPSLALTQGEKPGTGVVLVGGAPTGIAFSFLEEDLPTMRLLARFVSLGQVSERYSEHFRAYSEATDSLAKPPTADLPAPVRGELAEVVAFLDEVKAH